MGTSRCCTWTTWTSGMVGALAAEPPEQPAVASAKTRQTVTAQIETFDIRISPAQSVLSDCGRPSKVSAYSSTCAKPSQSRLGLGPLGHLLEHELGGDAAHSLQDRK